MRFKNCLTCMSFQKICCHKFRATGTRVCDHLQFFNTKSLTTNQSIAHNEACIGKRQEVWFDQLKPLSDQTVLSNHRGMKALGFRPGAVSHFWMEGLISMVGWISLIRLMLAEAHESVYRRVRSAPGVPGDHVKHIHDQSRDVDTRWPKGHSE